MSALSTCETKYIATAYSVCHAICLRRSLEQMKKMEKNEKKKNIFIDNNSAIALAKNHVHHERSKNIDTLSHFTTEQVKNKEVESKTLYV